jgi:hypothetical protein
MMCRGFFVGDEASEARRGFANLAELILVVSLSFSPHPEERRAATRLEG